METKGCYYVILLVYVLLWMCQCTAGHLTHSLIILTDSYINLYKILDISLGIIHLQTQKQVRQQRELNEGGTIKMKATLAGRLFGHTCTYDFKRLPVLGSFVNGLFLAALMMSAAIEGIQTCFHVSHSSRDDERSILFVHPLIYPGILVGFALVGIVMQWCSNRAHEMREEELDSESRWNLSEPAALAELNANKLLAVKSSNSNFNLLNSSFPSIDSPLTAEQQMQKRNTICLGGINGNHKLMLGGGGNHRLHTSFESVPLDTGEPMKRKQMISLTSLKVAKGLEDPNYVDLTSSVVQVPDAAGPKSIKRQPKRDRWLMIRYCVSPLALILCAMIVYFIHEELVTEVADAALAIMVVVLLFSASYPPMKKAGKVLLQTAPDQVDVDRLKAQLKGVSPLIVQIREFHVWSLTARSNRVATCHIVLDKDLLRSGKQLSQLIDAIKCKLLDYNIKHCTIQPVFADPEQVEEESSTQCDSGAPEEVDHGCRRDTCCA